jgi:hypothetical protein
MTIAVLLYQVVIAAIIIGAGVSRGKKLASGHLLLPQSGL